MTAPTNKILSPMSSETNLLDRGSHKGYSVWSAAVYITSFMAGMGVLALPHALAGTGWCGIMLIALACVNSWYSSMILGDLWMVLEGRWEEYKGKFRYPYPAIGIRAVGPWMRYVVTALLHMTLVGIAVVYILLCAQVALSLTKVWFVLDYKTWIIILSAVICPLSWFGSIEEFWFAAVGALATAGLGCISLLVGVILEIPTAEKADYGHVNFQSSSLAFGTILFGFGGAYMFPTIQNDMANKQKFNKASLLGYAGLLLLYVPVTIAGYAIMGHTVAPNILHSIKDGPLKIFIETCLATHIFLAFLIAINPVMQEAEEAFGVKSGFNYKRCLTRSFVIAVILIIAYTIPHFDKVLNLIGGSAITLLNFVLPPIFYFRLNRADAELNIPKRKIHWAEKIFLVQIMVTGFAGGITCTFFAVRDIIDVIVNGDEGGEINISI